MSLFNYPSPLWKLRAAFAFVVTVLSVVVWTPYVLTLTLFKNRSATTAAIRSWNKFILKVMGVKVRTHFLSTYSPDQPCLIASNHQSHLDIPVVYVALSGHVRMVAKKELFEIPFFGHCLAAAEFIPIDRGNRDAGLKAIQNIRKRIQSGLQIWVAPEGTRSNDGKLQTFKSGAFSVAIEAKVPVQPIAVKGAINVLNKKSYLPRPGLFIDVYVLPQISTEGYKPEDRSKIAQLTQKAISDVLEGT